MLGIDRDSVTGNFRRFSSWSPCIQRFTCFFTWLNKLVFFIFAEQTQVSCTLSICFFSTHHSPWIPNTSKWWMKICFEVVALHLLLQTFDLHSCPSALCLFSAVNYSSTLDCSRKHPEIFCAATYPDNDLQKYDRQFGSIVMSWWTLTQWVFRYLCPSHDAVSLVVMKCFLHLTMAEVIFTVSMLLLTVTMLLSVMQQSPRDHQQEAEKAALLLDNPPNSLTQW